MAISHLKSGGFHLVVAEVIPVCGNADSFYFHDLWIASDCIDFDLLMGK